MAGIFLTVHDTMFKTKRDRIHMYDIYNQEKIGHLYFTMFNTKRSLCHVHLTMFRTKRDRRSQSFHDVLIL